MIPCFQRRACPQRDVGAMPPTNQLPRPKHHYLTIYCNPQNILLCLYQTGSSTFYLCVLVLLKTCKERTLTLTMTIYIYKNVDVCEKCAKRAHHKMIFYYYVCVVVFVVVVV